MNKKILFSIAMMFSTMSNAATINNEQWEISGDGMAIYSKDNHYIAVMDADTLAFAKFEKCTTNDEAQNPYYFDVAGLMTEFELKCSNNNLKRYYIKTPNRLEQIIDSFIYQSKVKAFDTEFSTNGFVDKFKELSNL
ncbi:hypothetical protein [Vibrio parahaemolyticus]|uniref:hypothetical protein n=1 Tax=Vibrio parahaemolyticus TaxID=670 RepID=UPI0004236A30|nr:hypothetical protein [Vibrio parahaemolyticus]MCX8889874.1 hypothetical protein [Vibrio parahaemolyticus]MQF57104.1 hypothetical protein [Vibrio parahaemolyticus]TNZ17903.1 hypothetical protein CGK58_00055 [Vibrio parahaemolyticus]HBB9986390.1 hypothetical protein [Vibrio parahaemolyticus]HCE1923302.1 hypothetical protein [Vibrio parahaemolyticus]